MRLGLLLVVALLAMAEGGAVLADSEAMDMASATPDQASLALESEDGNPAVAQAEPAGFEDSADALDTDVWAGELDEDTAEQAPASAEDEMGDTMPVDGAVTTQTEPVVPTDGTDIKIAGAPIVVNGIALGPVGIDGQGRVGRVHTVVSGDTLWDVSRAYLGTAWVWPSVWDENSKIQNPHLIEPGDRLWISSTEIRVITEDEANAYLAANTAGDDMNDVVAEMPAELDDDAAVEDEGFTAAMDDDAAVELDQMPVEMPENAKRSDETGRTVRISNRENMSFLSEAQLEAATSILGSTTDRLRLSMPDTIYLGVGKGEVKVGDEFTLFRSITEVRSPSTHELLGHHVDVLGWAEVTEVAEESSVAVIRVSVDGAMKGDRAIARHQPPTDIPVKHPKAGIDGEVAFLPASRTLMGTADYVFIDVGAVHGVEVGTDLEVYEPGKPEMDRVRKQKRMTPDRVVADLVVVTVQEESSVAFVAHTRREIAVGDSVRGATRDFPAAF